MEVSQAYEAKKGEIFDFHYTVRGWGKQGQIESLVRKLDEDPRWKVIQFEYKNSSLRLRVKVIENPLPLVLILVAITAIGGGLFCWLSLDKIEKVVSDPIGGLAILGTVVGGLMLLRKLK